jgi:hypothetical protein
MIWWGTKIYKIMPGVYLGAHAKLQNPMTTPSGRISNEPEERRKKKEEEKKMPFIVADYVYASNQGQRTHSALTKTARSKMIS